ncbi:MAG: BON domain-containing protein [Desulfobacterales bacterium]|nr:BON domain-containing protein [Desulfobacterales bacterium]
MAIVTISKVAGTPAERVARTVAEHLDYRYADKEIADRLADFGFRQEDQDSFVDKATSFWHSFSQSRIRFHQDVKKVVSETARQGNLVIHGWGAQLVLRDIGGVLKVRITTPLEIRRENLVSELGCSGAEAETLIRKRDGDSAGYIRTFFGADWSDPDLYDLTINSAQLSVDSIVGIIFQALNLLEFTTRRESLAEELQDRALLYSVESRLQEIDGSETISAEVKKGVVTLTGVVDKPAIKQNCASMAEELAADARLDNQIRVLADNLE